jgi:transcription elongation factor Elf1
MSESKRTPKEVKIKQVKYVNGTLACQRCTSRWLVVDLNLERKVVPCPVCAEFNDIREAAKRANDVTS